MSASTYPVHVQARLDPKLSRGLWLVKWLLVVPHYILLAALWVAFAMLSIVAFFAILVTGRYPRAIFEFNVGVLRWSWRVAYYAYGALGTDRYPPFSLKDDPGYPARLDVEYPERLSRGLVLVKWWLLALPHYLVVTILLGSGAYVAGRTSSLESPPWVWGGGLIGLLATVGAVVLLFTGRYPESVFDLVLGLNRWVLRVAGYAGLMTDEYPPFRLDQGGEDPGPGQLSLPLRPAAPSAGTAGATTAEPWTAGRVMALVTGALGLLLSIGLVCAGAALAYADAGMRDGSGYLMTDGVALETETYAVTSPNLVLRTSSGLRAVPRNAIGDVKVTVTALSGKVVFVGIAPTRDVTAYLRGVGHVTLVARTSEAPAYETSAGAGPSVPPAAGVRWAAQGTTAGTQSVIWPATTGDWSVVVMNADGSAGVAARAAVGATLPVLDWLVPTLLFVGGAGLLVSIVLVAGAAAAAQHSVRRGEQR